MILQLCLPCTSGANWFPYHRQYLIAVCAKTTDLFYLKKLLAGNFHLLKWMISVNNWHQHYKCLGRSGVKVFSLIFSGKVRRSRWRGSLHCYRSSSKQYSASANQCTLLRPFSIRIVQFYLLPRHSVQIFDIKLTVNFSSLCVLHTPPISSSMYCHFNSTGSLFGHLPPPLHRAWAATESAVVRKMSERLGREEYKLT